MSDTYFAISYSPGLLPLFRLGQLGPARSGVWVGPDVVRVRMGWGFRAEIPRRAVRQAVADSGAVGAWGVHGWRGHWLVNGSSSGLVRLELEPGVKATMMGLPVDLTSLRVSVLSPEGLTGMLQEHR